MCLEVLGDLGDLRRGKEGVPRSYISGGFVPKLESRLEPYEKTPHLVHQSLDLVPAGREGLGDL